MKTTFYSLVVIPPFGSRGPKIQISRPAVLILAAAFAVSFFVAVGWLLLFPRIQSSDTARYRLAAENQTLKIDNKNAEFRVRRLNTQLSHVEELSNRITALIDAD